MDTTIFELFCFVLNHAVLLSCLSLQSWNCVCSVLGRLALDTDLAQRFLDILLHCCTVGINWWKNYDVVSEKSSFSNAHILKTQTASHPYLPNKTRPQFWKGSSGCTRCRSCLCLHWCCSCSKSQWGWLQTARAAHRAAAPMCHKDFALCSVSISHHIWIRHLLFSSLGGSLGRKLLHKINH